MARIVMTKLDVREQLARRNFDEWFPVGWYGLEMRMVSTDSLGTFRLRGIGQYPNDSDEYEIYLPCNNWAEVPGVPFMSVRTYPTDESGIVHIAGSEDAPWRSF